MKGFAKNLVEQFNVSSDGAHVATMVFSTKPQVMLKFSDSLQNVSSSIDGLPHQRGFTYIDRALIMADQEMFSVASGMRAEATKVKIAANDKC